MPTKVQMLNKAGTVKFEMTASVRRLRDEGYRENAHWARVSGPDRAAVTFYDDQQFRTGENYVYIQKTTDDPVDVPLQENFVEAAEKVGAAIFRGESVGYNWILFKNPKEQLWSQFLNPIFDAADKLSARIGLNWEVLVEAAESSGKPPLVIAGKVVGFLSEKGRKSNNYRVDNCSSVRFGPPERP